MNYLAYSYVAISPFASGSLRPTRSYKATNKDPGRKSDPNAAFQLQCNINYIHTCVITY